MGFICNPSPSFRWKCKRVKLEVQDAYSQFARRLETHLEQNGVDVVIPVLMRILEVPVNETRKEIQSIGDNARVREFLFGIPSSSACWTAEGTELIPLQTFEQSRVYSFNEQDILSAEREDEFLANDLADSLARMVVRRLGTFGK